MVVRPRGFNERAARAPVARVGDAPLAARCATRILRRNQADEGGQLPWVVEAGEVAELGDDGDRDEPLDTAQGLQSLHDRIESPAWRGLAELGLDPGDAIDRLIDSPDVFLKDDLLGGCGAHPPSRDTAGARRSNPRARHSADPVARGTTSAAAWRPSS